MHVDGLNSMLEDRLLNFIWALLCCNAFLAATWLIGVGP